MATKKVKETGKFGVRGGVGIRKRYLLATESDFSKYVCPKCGTTGKIYRKAKGIFVCKKCNTQISGGAYQLVTSKI